MIFDIKNDMYQPLGRSVENFRPLCALEVSNSYNGIVREGVREGGREGHFVCCLELLRN